MFYMRTYCEAYQTFIFQTIDLLVDDKNYENIYIIKI